jgi:hypothetical protein
MICTAIIAVVMAAVLLWVRPKPLVWVAMIGNFIATMVLRDSPLAVGVADVTAGALMLLAGPEMWAIAAIFAIMTCIDVAAWQFGFNLNATYAIIEVLAYIQLIIIAGGGFGRKYRHRNNPRRAGDRRASYPVGGMARLGSLPVPVDLSISEQRR